MTEPLDDEALRAAVIRGGYAIGIQGAAEGVEAAFASLTEPAGFDFSWGPA